MRYQGLSSDSICSLGEAVTPSVTSQSTPAMEATIRDLRRFCPFWGLKNGFLDKTRSIPSVCFHWDLLTSDWEAEVF